MKLLTCVAYLLLSPIMGALLEGVDRIITARMQGRQGPPLLQPLYDCVKLLQKEPLRVNGAQFLLAGSYGVLVLLSGALFYAGNDILLTFFTLTTAEIFLVMAASTTYSPYSGMGASRELMQMASYEPMVLLTGVAFYVAKGSFRVGELALSGGLPAICYLPGVFVGFVLLLTLKLRKSPFDVSTSHHAHQEMVKGITAELSGPSLACVSVAEWYEEMLLLGLVGLFFFNGTWWSALLAVVGVEAVYFLEILIDNCSARVRWETMFKLCWGITLAACGLNLLVLQLLL